MNSIEEFLLQFVDKPLLEKYKSINKINTVTTATLIPFAILFGNKQFKQLIHQIATPITKKFGNTRYELVI